MGCFFETGLSLWPFFNFDNERCQVFFYEMERKKDSFLFILLSWLSSCKKKIERKKEGRTFSKFFNIFRSYSCGIDIGQEDLAFVWNRRHVGVILYFLTWEFPNQRFTRFFIYIYELEKYYLCKYFQ